MKRNSKTSEVMAVRLPDFMELQVLPFLSLFSFQDGIRIISRDHFIAMICIGLNPDS
jgi:hypothetical protein